MACRVRGACLAGTLSVADLTVYDVLVVAEKLNPGVIAKYPSLARFVARVAARPGVAKWIGSEIKAKTKVEQIPVVNPDGTGIKPEWEE